MARAEVNPKRNARWIFESARLFLGVLLIWSSLMKIQQPGDFLARVYLYQMLPRKAVLIFAVCLPWIELLTAICLIGGVFVEGAFIVAFLLGGLFTSAVSQALLRGLQISCACFSTGSNDGRISVMTLFRALSVMAVGLVGLTSLKNHYSMMKPSAPDRIII